MSYNYATNLLPLGLVWHGHQRGRRQQNFALLEVPDTNFSSRKAYNYAKEGFILSERKIMELKRSRTVNMHGRQGPLKYMIGNLQSNVTPYTI